MKNQKNNQILLSIIGVAILIVAVVGVSFAFFNYTRTGNANTLSVGRIYFNHTQDGKIELSNIFPTNKNNLDSTNSDTVTINITGDTTYTEGIEYKVTLEEVNNEINNKEIPISIKATATNLGTEDNNYYTNRENKTKIYLLNEEGEAYNGKYIAVGYIPAGSTGVNGIIDITAFIDTNKIAITDTYLNETDEDWVMGREIFTTTEWNSFNSGNPLSFKVKVEANEGIWVEKEKFLTMKNLNSITEWTNIRANITSIEFHKDGVAPANYITSFDVTDSASDSSKGNITLYTVDDGLGNNTYKAIVVANDTIYAPESCYRMFRNMSNLITFNSINFKVESTTDIRQIFINNLNLKNIDSLSTWNTYNILSMQSAFANCSNLSSIEALSNWNVDNVEAMMSMFNGCTNLIDISGLSNWNVGKVTNMAGMYNGCAKLEDISELSNWNVSSVKNMQNLFCGCTNLIDISPLSDWATKTGKVENMTFMFGMDANTAKVNNAIIDFSPLSNWNVSNVINMSSMFQNVNILSYQAFANWNVGKVQNFNNMFNQTNASVVTTLIGLENWNVSSAIDMSGMFYENVRLNDASAINDWNINAIVDFTEMFGGGAKSHPEFTKFPNGTWDSNGTFTPNAS